MQGENPELLFLVHNNGTNYYWMKIVVCDYVVLYIPFLCLLEFIQGFFTLISEITV